MKYPEFLKRKAQQNEATGFSPLFMPDWLFDFQTYLVDYSIRQGRSANFADCGLGKGLMSLVWAQNAVEHTNRPVIILAPLAVSFQFQREADKFGFDNVEVSKTGKFSKKIVITNYESINHFDPNDFVATVCDEGSRVKYFDSKTKELVLAFTKNHRYRLLGTATAAPNDYFELGNTSEVLGYLTYNVMLKRFFKREENRRTIGGSAFRLKGHAEVPFWKWVSSFARACRKPSDLGFDDDGFILPKLIENEVVVRTKRNRGGTLIPLQAVSLNEQREERRITLGERCQKASDLASSHNGSSVIWCHLNKEADLCEKITPEALQVSGSMCDGLKEERLLAFQNGELKRLIIKPKIGGFGLNWQHCHNVITFPSHSFEAHYQSIRRCYRFGQENDVVVNIITTEGERRVLQNLRRKSEQAVHMFDSLVKHMREVLEAEEEENEYINKERIPSWL